MRIATVAAGFPRAFLDFAVSRGADRQSLMRKAQLDPEQLADQDARVPLASYVTLVEAAIAACGEPALPLLFGEAFDIADLSVLGLIGNALGNPGEGRDEMNRYSRLALDDGTDSAARQVELVPTDGYVAVHWVSPAYVQYPLLAESGFARAVTGMKKLFSPAGGGDVPFLRAVHFTHAEPAHRAEYDRIFRVPLVFASRTNAIVLDPSFLEAKLPHAHPYLAGVLRKHADGLLEKLADRDSIRARVEALLEPVLATRGISVDAVAARLGMSRQTLFRRLKAEGVTFTAVVDELRRRTAMRHLDAGKSVHETALLAGFSEPAAFSRAYRRWTGRTPGAHARSG